MRWPGGREIEKRVTALGAAGLRTQTRSAATPVATTQATAETTTQLRPPRAGVAAAATNATPDALSEAIHFSSSVRSFADCHRSSDSFCKHFFITRSSA